MICSGSGEVSVADTEGGKRDQKQVVRHQQKEDHLGSIGHSTVWILFLVLREFSFEQESDVT